MSWIWRKNANRMGGYRHGWNGPQQFSLRNFQCMSSNRAEALFSKVILAWTLDE